MDAAAYAFFGSIITGLIAGAVALVSTIINSRTERTKVGHLTAAEIRAAELAVKDERIALRDEQLADCQQQNARLQAQLDQCSRT